MEFFSEGVIGGVVVVSTYTLVKLVFDFVKSNKHNNNGSNNSNSSSNGNGNVPPRWYLLASLEERIQEQSKSIEKLISKLEQLSVSIENQTLLLEKVLLKKK